MAKSKIKLWINSLSIESAKNPEVKIKNDGASKQWSTHMNDDVAAYLSVLNCDLTDIWLNCDIFSLYKCKKNREAINLASL